MSSSFKVKLTFVELLGHGVVWMGLILITLGLAFLIWPYYLVQFVLSRAVWVDEQQRERPLVVGSGFVAYVGHALLWLLAMLLTFGLAMPLWLYDVVRFVLKHTRVGDVPGNVQRTL
jgi:hypothetical protein